MFSPEDETPLQDALSMAPGDYGAAIAKMCLTLLALVALLFLTFWLLRKFIRQRLQKGVGKQAIQIIEKKMISPKTILYLVEVEGKKTLIAESHLEVKRIDGWVVSRPDAE